MDDYLHDLNAAQREGVIHTGGPCMIIAGAGSGKTRVITCRIAHMLRQGVDAFSIMALTFTNKAAREMRRRVEATAGAEARHLWMGTFHSVFARILRVEGHRLGYPAHFVIYDTEDSLALLKTLAREMRLDEEQYKPRTVFNQISAAKNRLVSWQDYLQDGAQMQEDAANLRPEIGALYKAYALRCFQSGAMDFDDLLFNTDKLFKNHLDALNKYQHLIRYVLVDEFQDTNLCQYFIVRKLAAVQQNICVVGDDAQSIYAFRGADISNILNFEKDYPQLRAIKLEQNYRSTGAIVEAANSVIAKNKARIPKHSWTANKEGEPLELIRAMSDNEEGRLIATSVFTERMQRQLSLNEFAILYRTNSQSRALEEALRKANIRYRIVGGLSFYQRKEVKDLLAYFRFTLNQQDEASLRRIINFPKRGIGDTTMDKLTVAAHAEGSTLWAALEKAEQIVSRQAAHAIDEFVHLIRRCAIDAQGRDAYEAALGIAKRSGLLRLAQEERTPEGQSRYENMQELLNAIKEFSAQEEREERSLATFLQEAALMTSADEDYGDQTERVTLMTMHMAKGLEFSHVYIAGLEEDLFPSPFMLNSRADLEEERRLFYVALTRAKEKLFISYALTRYRFGRLRNCEPSRFINDIDPQYIKAATLASESRFGAPEVRGGNNNQWVSALRRSGFKAPMKRVDEAQPQRADFAASDTSGLRQGMRVEHPRFGFGEVASVSDMGVNHKATVRFEGFGEKTLLLSFAKLRICAE